VEVERLGRLMDAHRDDVTDDYVCEHGVAMDVHCCNCHSGFIFDKDHVCGDEPGQPADAEDEED
jgi:hypothetical protein